MKVSRVQPMILLWISLTLSACDANRATTHDQTHKITVTTVESKAVTLTHQYICQIHSRRRVVVCATTVGYVAAIPIREGQAVKRADLLFQVRPVLFKEKVEAKNTDNVVSIRAPFDGIIDHLAEQQGSLVKEGDTLTTLSDNSAMWVYFNVPEKRYLEYMAEAGPHKQSPDIELILTNHSKFPQTGKIGAIEADFNSETGTIAFRADFPNPDGLLHHGQIGTVLLKRVLKDAIVIPQRTTFEVLNKRYVFVVDKDDVAHQREIVIQNETDDLFVVETGVGVNDKIVLDGVRVVHDGAKVKY